MDDRTVISEPVADTEADWSTGTKSTLQPLQHETGEFDRLVSDASSIEDVGLGSPEDLASHMRALVGGKEKTQEAQDRESEKERDGVDEDDSARSGRGLFRSGERGLFSFTVRG